jgi:hypothetical protein
MRGGKGDYESDQDRRTRFGCSVCCLSGCATQPSNVQAAYVSTMKYDTFDCRRLTREAEEVDIRLRQTTGTLQTKANTDALLMTVGLIIFWPALLVLPATGGSLRSKSWRESRVTRTR